MSLIRLEPFSLELEREFVAELATLGAMAVVHWGAVAVALDHGSSHVRLDCTDGPASVRVVAAVVEVFSSHVRLDSVAAGLCFGSGSALVRCHGRAGTLRGCDRDSVDRGSSRRAGPGAVASSRRH